MRTGVMIEGRRHPLLRVVAITTIGLVILRDELPVMFVFVTRLARRRGTFESGFGGCARFVAIRASDRAMCS